jgi:hypothetical protein
MMQNCTKDAIFVLKEAKALISQNKFCIFDSNFASKDAENDSN